MWCVFGLDLIFSSVIGILECFYVQDMVFSSFILLGRDFISLSSC